MSYGHQGMEKLVTALTCIGYAGVRGAAAGQEQRRAGVGPKHTLAWLWRDGQGIQASSSTISTPEIDPPLLAYPRQ